MITLFIKKAITTREKIVGLIGEKHIYPLWLETRFGIHTFGVRFPLDIVILNEKFEVVALCEGIRPNRIFLWNPTYKHVLELPEGTILKKKITTGSRLKLVVQ